MDPIFRASIKASSWEKHTIPKSELEKVIGASNMGKHFSIKNLSLVDIIQILPEIMCTVGVISQA
jgi:hypothetical protein